MSGKNPKSDKGRPLVSPLLIFALLIAIAYALFTFFVVNKQFAYPPSQESLGQVPARYHVLPSQITRNTMHTETIPQSNTVYANLKPPGPHWNAWVDISEGTAGRHKVRIKAITIYDKPVDLDEFNAQISLVGNTKAILPGVAFSQTDIGEYTAEVILPTNGEWEVRGRFKKGLEVILIAQKIAPLLPK